MLTVLVASVAGGRVGEEAVDGVIEGLLERGLEGHGALVERGAPLIGEDGVLDVAVLGAVEVPVHGADVVVVFVAV
jgi:hypothetical protein